MNEFDSEEQLRQLVEALDEVTPTDEEAQAVCEALGIDLDALHARILAMVDAYEAGELSDVEERPPESHLRDRRTHHKVAGPTPLEVGPPSEVEEEGRAVRIRRRDSRGRGRR